MPLKLRLHEQPTARQGEEGKACWETATGKETGVWAMNEGRTSDRVFCLNEEINRSTTGKK